MSYTGAPAINVGASVESVKEARGAINDILRSSADQQTKQIALEVLAKITQVNNTTISQCHIAMGAGAKVQR